MSARFAIYLAPPTGSALHETGSALLGRDAATGEAVPFPALEGISPERWRAITEDARGYGFHGTMKPPFRLKSGESIEGLEASLAAFARDRPAFDAPPLVLRAISGFLALVPEREDPRILDLAADCVRAFDRFRAPAPPEELARRRKAGLSPRQEEYLLKWGYPYVMEEFRLHFTLSCRLEANERERVAAALTPHVGRFAGHSQRVDGLTLFEQPVAGAPFLIRARYPLGG